MAMENKAPSKSLHSEQTERIQDETISFEEKLKTDGVVLELNGRKGPEPTRFGDWEKKGKCVDF